jgi:hypothetical protein
MRIHQLVLSALIVSGFYSCRHEPDFESMKAVSFASDIQPILSSNCTMSGCHSSSNSGHGGEDDEAFSLTTYDEVIDHGEIEAGNAHKSKLYESISNHGEKLMPPPPRPALTTDQIKLIYVWIEQGAKNN